MGFRASRTFKEVSGEIQGIPKGVSRGFEGVSSGTREFQKVTDSLKVCFKGSRSASDDTGGFRKFHRVSERCMQSESLRGAQRFRGFQGISGALHRVSTVL